MADKYVRIGSMEDIHIYDDGDYAESIEVDAPIKITAVPSDPEHAIRQEDLDIYAEGPGAATDNAIARFDGATGKSIQNSSLLLDDSGNLSKNVDDLALDCGANKTLTLIQPVYEDIQFQISSGRIGVANAPNWQALTTNTSEYAFDVNDYIDLGSNELMHRWKEGTMGSAHMHISLEIAQSSGADRFAKFTLYIAYKNPATSIWVETSLTEELTIPNGSSALQHFYLALGDLTLTNNIIGDQIKLRIKRIAATGGTEYPDLIYIHQVGIHVQCDTMGSRSESSK